MNKNAEDYIKIQLKVDNEKRTYLDKTKKLLVLQNTLRFI